MNADDLRAVAKEIREKANAATTGDGPTLSRVWFSQAQGAWLKGGWTKTERFEVIALDEGSLIANGLNSWTAEHIAAWHPAVTLAVADWLDDEADYCDETQRLPTQKAIAVVRAWRGTS